MTQVKQINLINESMIMYLNSMGVEAKRNEIIRQILKDEACFFKIDKSDACIILEDIGVSKEKIDEMYLKLISSENYFNLIRNGKLNENDEELKVKYNMYNSEDLFKKIDIKENLENEESKIAVKQEKSVFKKIFDKIKSIFRNKF